LVKLSVLRPQADQDARFRRREAPWTRRSRSPDMDTQTAGKALYGDTFLSAAKGINNSNLVIDDVEIITTTC
jgi:hypothetical protein